MTRNPANQGDDAQFDTIDTEELSTESKPQVDVFIDDTGDYRAVGPFNFLPVTNGSDVLELLDAIDNSLSQPAKIHVGAGDYSIDNTLSDGPEFEVTTSGLTLEGDGAATHMRLADGATDSNEGSKLIEVAYSASRVTFKNFYLDGNYQNQNPSNIGQDDGHNIAVFGDEFHMEGVYSWNSTGDGVEAFGTPSNPNNPSTNGTVANCHFQDNYEQNVHLNGCKEWIVDGCILDGTQQTQLLTTFTSSGAPTERCIISNCTFLNGVNSAIGINGAGSARDIQIRDCLFYNNEEDAINVVEVSGADFAPKNISVQGCEIIEPGRNGITLNARTEMQEVRVQDTSIRDADMAGLAFISVNGGDYTDITINGAEIVDPRMNTTGPAIDMSPADNSFKRVSVKGGRIVSKASGSDVNNAINTFIDGTGGFTDCKITDVVFEGYTSDSINQPDNIETISGLVNPGFKLRSAEFEDFFASLSKNTDTAVEWTARDLDKIYVWDTNNYELTVSRAGDYHVDCQLRYNNQSSGDQVFIKLEVNGSIVRETRRTCASSVGFVNQSITLKDLSKGDKIKWYARSSHSDGGAVSGSTSDTWATVTRVSE
jgi:hypothetical protein